MSDRRRPAGPTPDPGATPDPAYAALKARIVARTGHHYYADKDDLLLDRLRRRYRAHGVTDAAAYGRLLDAGPAGEAEWAALEAEITIGETFFFRYAEQFEALRTTILPDLIAARAGQRALRVWSAGCSTGAEPYSIAVLLHDLLGAERDAWSIRILGTDISTEALDVARAGVYGRWALRTTGAAERARLFRLLPPEPGTARGGRYLLRPEFRRAVRFERGNLLALVDAPPPREPYDLVLCRNVLIYFDAATVAGIMRGLGRCLAPGGWLLIGHAEPNPSFSAWLTPVALPGTMAYRPAGPEAQATARDFARDSAQDSAPPSPVRPAGDGGIGLPAPTATEAVAPARADPGAPVRPVPSAPGDHVTDTTSPDAASPDDRTPAVDGLGPADVLAAVRALADAGESGAAWRLIGQALRERPTEPGLRYYEGLVARALGREAEAERALRAALYLDRGFVMAHYHLGLLLVALGRGPDARRALDNAVRLGQALPAGTVLPEADGASAGEIAAIAAATRDGLGPGGPRRGDPGRADPGPSDLGQADPGQADPGPSDPGPGDPGRDEAMAVESGRGPA